MRKGGTGQCAIMLKRNRGHKVTSDEIRSLKVGRLPIRPEQTSGAFSPLVFALRASMACAVTENRFGQPARRCQPGGALNDV